VNLCLLETASRPLKISGARRVALLYGHTKLITQRPALDLVFSFFPALIVSSRPFFNLGETVLRTQPSTSAMAPSGESEAAFFAREVRDMKQWWSDPRFRHTKRPYTAEEAVSMRGTLPETFASNEMAQKLWAVFEKARATGGYTHTFGALDPVQVIEMAPHLQSVYVSGWQCSSTASSSNEPGPDFADYPMDTVPRVSAALMLASCVDRATGSAVCCRRACCHFLLVARSSAAACL
jgi:Isocitrate lyase family